MSIPLSRLANQIIPENTVLFFGSGATLDSNAPSVLHLISSFSEKFDIDSSNYNLRDITAIIEEDFSRKKLIDELRIHINRAKPTGSIKNLPLYEWKSIYTTNYDTVVEQSYKYRDKDLIVYSSNHDFTTHNKPLATKYFKLHGTIEKDVAYGDSSRIIISDLDYDHISEYTDNLFKRFESDISDSQLIIIGHSLSDEHIRDIANKAANFSKKIQGNEITLFIFNKDERRAKIWEKRGFQVCFGGLDDLFNELSATLESPAEGTLAKGIFDSVVGLAPTTFTVSDELSRQSNANKMVNGWPASYSDIQENLTFKRDISTELIENILSKASFCFTLLGPSGVGKTTLARAVLLSLSNNGVDCYEHKKDFQLNPSDWLEFAKLLNKEDRHACLLVDDAHLTLRELLRLIEDINTLSISNLSLILTSTKDKWNVRIKNPSYFNRNINHYVNQLSENEIDSLIKVVDRHLDIKKAINSNFDGFSLTEKKRRLKVQCESETFVCLKNIFATESFDDIILKEYASLEEEVQQIYRLVSALEYCGVRVHRQLIIRLLGIGATVIHGYLDRLLDIITEYEINKKEGLYGWKGRHPVITEILTKYKYQDKEELFELIESVIDSISPTYDIEVKTLRDLCNFETGIPSFQDRYEQNRLFRKMISIVPNERIPRHRLISNLVELEEFDGCDSEIKVYEKDFGKRDPTIYRYRVKLKISRAIKTSGLMDEDREAILYQAAEDLVGYIESFPTNRFLLKEMCNLGLIIGGRNDDYSYYDNGLKLLKQAEDILQDPEVTLYITRFERKRLGSL